MSVYRSICFVYMRNAANEMSECMRQFNHLVRRVASPFSSAEFQDVDFSM